MQAECQYCHRVFEVKWPHNPNRFCSRECHLRAKGKREFICLECGRAFHRKPSLIKNKDRCFCSRTCLFKWRRANPSLKRELTHCAWCGKEILVHPYRLREGHPIYCSKGCLNKARAAKMSGERNPLWKRVKMACTYCGKAIWIPSWQIRRSKTGRFFCNKECFDSYQRTSEEFKLEQAEKILKGNRARPNKLEARFIEFCSKYNLPLRYVGDGSLIIEGRSPDFVSGDGKHLVELFGKHWHEERPSSWLRLAPIRKSFFEAKGYNVLILWDDSLKYEQKLVKRVKRFISSSKPLPSNK